MVKYKSGKFRCPNCKKEEKMSVYTNWLSKTIKNNLDKNVEETYWIFYYKRIIEKKQFLNKCYKTLFLCFNAILEATCKERECRLLPLLLILIPFNIIISSLYILIVVWIDLFIYLYIKKNKCKYQYLHKVYDLKVNKNLAQDNSNILIDNNNNLNNSHNTIFSENKSIECDEVSERDLWNKLDFISEDKGIKEEIINEKLKFLFHCRKCSWHSDTFKDFIKNNKDIIKNKNEIENEINIPLNNDSSCLPNLTAAPI